MSGQIVQKATRFLKQVYAAQDGLCFHCGKLMLWAVPSGHCRNDGWTREHVHPKADTGRGMQCNIVLAHPLCNQEKGARQPTEIEVRRAQNIYARMGLVAFHRHPVRIGGGGGRPERYSKIHMLWKQQGIITLGEYVQAEA